MDVLLLLIPLALFLGFIGLAAFYWSLKSGQFDDPEGNAARILHDDLPLAPPPKPSLKTDENEKAGVS